MSGTSVVGRMNGGSRRRLLIVGCGMATARLLQELVTRGHDYTIDVIGEETSPAYNRVLLSALLAGDKHESDLVLEPREWYARHHIALHTGEQVVAVDTQARTALTSHGRQFAWDELVFATGSVPACPVVKGIDTGAVLMFRNMADLDRIRAAAAHARCAVVLGAGLLGLEAAHGLRHLGLDVTVLHRQPWILNRQLDQRAAGVLQSELERQGLHFALGRQPREVLSQDGRVQQVLLDDGTALPCDLLLVATGVWPNAGLARDAGLACDQGILVDAAMQTSVAGVHALGECCQHGDRLYGLVAPVQEQAVVLAARLTGDAAAVYAYRDAPVHLKIAGVQVVSGGVFPFPADSESQVLCDPARGVYRRLVFSAGRLCSFVLVGDKRNAQWYQSLLEQGATVRELRSSMMFSPPPQRAATFSPSEQHHG